MGELSATDVSGLECADHNEAKLHAEYLSRRLDFDSPKLARPGNFISVRGRDGEIVFQVPIHAGGGSVRHFQEQIRPDQYASHRSPHRATHLRAGRGY
ncbi:MAG: hypothetical protein P4M07_19670 [Xanthobacteraceae bacterium]|nr:hypothetical protein [Xanthobacteraceae bacterium]